MAYKSTPTVRDMMVTKVVSLRPDTDVCDAIELLLKHRISGAPVIGASGEFLGVFSEKNCMSVVIKSAYEGLPTNEVLAFTDRAAPTTTEDVDMFTIAQTFLNTNARRLPVLRDGQLVGQVSRRDVLKAAHRLLDCTKPSDSGILYISSVRTRDEAPIG